MRNIRQQARYDQRQGLSPRPGNTCEPGQCVFHLVRQLDERSQAFRQPDDCEPDGRFVWTDAWDRRAELLQNQYAYSDTTGYATGDIALLASSTNNYSRGKQLADSDIQNIVSSAISSQSLPKDA
jgi:hypothetical protein